MSESATPECPGCKRVLLNRLVDYCLYCGEPIPVDLRLTDHEKSVIKCQQKDQIETECRMRKEKEAEERESESRNDDIDPTAFLL